MPQIEIFATENKYKTIYADPRIELFARRKFHGWDYWGDGL